MAVYSNYGIDIENYLEGCVPDTSVIPNYATINEMVYHVIESSEADFNRLMIEYGVAELNHLEENGSEMIYEEGKIKSMKDSAVKFFKDMWGKIQGMIQKAIETFQKKAQEVRAKILGKIDKSFLKKRVDNIPADKVFGTMYSYAAIDSFSANNRAFIQKADNEIDALYNKVVEQQKSGNNEIEGVEKSINEITSNCINKVLGSGTSRPSSGTSGMAKLLKDSIRGTSFQVTGAWVKKNFYDGKNIYKEVVEFPSTKAQLKKDYKELQKSFNEAIKKCKKADNSKMFEASAFTKAIKGYKTLRQVTVYSQQAIISCLNERYSFFRGILFKLIGVKPAQDDTKSTNESTTFDTIGSLFDDWD